MSTTITGHLADCAVCSRLDLHGVDLHLDDIDIAAPPWSAIAHVAVGRGDEARDQADAIARELLAAGRCRVVAAQQYVLGTVIHLLGDVRIEAIVAGAEARA